MTTTSATESAPAALSRHAWPAGWVWFLIGLVAASIQQLHVFYPKVVIYNRLINGSDAPAFYFDLFRQGILPSPLAYRPLSYALEMAGKRLLHWPIGQVDTLINIVCLALAFPHLARFARPYLAPRDTLIALLWMVVAMTIGFEGYLHQPSDFPNLLFCAWLYGAGPVLPVGTAIVLGVLGTLNRESFILFWSYPVLRMVWERATGPRLGRLVIGVGACILAGLTVFLIIGPSPAYEKFFMLPHNLTPIAFSRWGPDLLLGIVPPLAISLVGWRRLPSALRAGVVVAMGYVLLMLLIGNLEEFRLLFPVLPLLVVSAMSAAQPWFQPPAEVAAET